MMNNLLNGLLVVASGVSLWLSYQPGEQPSNRTEVDSLGKQAQAVIDDYRQSDIVRRIKCVDAPAKAQPAPRPEWQEADYIDAFADDVRGESEVTLRDRTRVDVMTGRVAWEVDYAPNWYEAVGQALHYGHVSGRCSGVALIYRPDERYLVDRCRAVCERYGIALATCQAPE